MPHSQDDFQPRRHIGVVVLVDGLLWLDAVHYAVQHLKKDKFRLLGIHPYIYVYICVCAHVYDMYIYIFIIYSIYTYLFTVYSIYSIYLCMQLGRFPNCELVSPCFTPDDFPPASGAGSPAPHRSPPGPWNENSELGGRTGNCRPWKITILIGKS